MKKILFFATAIMVALVFASCEGNGPSNQGKGENHSRGESGMYVGIAAFNDDVTFFGGENARYKRLTNSNANEYTSFINNLNMLDGTVLYYTIDDALTYLTKCQFPSDLSSVSIVTFTDGLDVGSSMLDENKGLNNEYTETDSMYLKAVSEKIRSVNVDGHSVSAYTIGIRGDDVDSDNPKVVQLFHNNLNGLASSNDNAYEVANMDEVNHTFQEIASSLYKTNIVVKFSIICPQPQNNELQRFTLDNKKDKSQVDGSKCYIEGVYSKADKTFKNVKCVGCKYKGYYEGGEIKAYPAPNTGSKIQFDLEEFTDAEGNVLEINKQHMDQWRYYGSGWLHQGEFRPDDQPDPIPETHSAVVLLVLDCSSSLGSEFSKVKNAAKNFISIIAGSQTTQPDPTPDPDPEPTPEPEADYYIKHPWGGGTWTWQPMIYAGEYDDLGVVYEYTGAWGNNGININTKPSDNATSKWFPLEDIYVEDGIYLGEQVIFYYCPALADQEGYYKAEVYHLYEGYNVIKKMRKRK